MLDTRVEYKYRLHFLLFKIQVPSAFWKMPGQIKILRDERHVYQSPLTPETLPKLRPEFLATERVLYEHELYGVNGGRLNDVEVEAKLRFIVVPPMQDSNYFEELQV